MISLESSCLQQDAYSLLRETYPTPVGGTLEVIGWMGKTSSGSKNYVVKCDLCSQDPELFGEGLFALSKCCLLRGQTPCGCASNHRWSEGQNKVRVSREAQSRGFKFIGWASEYIGKNTKLLMSCPLHGEWNSTTMCSLMGGCGCPRCGKWKTRITRTKEDSSHIKDFMRTGSFRDGTEFFRSSKSNGQGQTVYWNYTCPKCSYDEYVQEGLCSGVFESYSGHIKKGWLSCRCSKNYRWSQEQREYQIKKEMKKRGEKGLVNYRFIGWVTTYKNPFSKFKYICINHGEQVITADNFLNSGQGCPECKGNTQLQSYINVVYDEGDTPVALKFGIANSSTERIRGQNYINLFQMQNIGVWEFPTTKSCKAAEKECKSKLNCGILSARELKDGWTETVPITCLDSVVEMYVSHGGVLSTTHETINLGDNCFYDIL